VEPWDHPTIYALRDSEGDALIAAAHAQGLHFSVNRPFLRDGALLHEVEMETDELVFEDEGTPGQRRYYRVELRGAPVHVPTPGALRFYGDLLAISNPVYVGFE
jgi:hypothetical protein